MPTDGKKLLAKIREKKCGRERVRRQKMQMLEKVKQSPNTMFFFACFVPSGGSKSRFAKATGAQPSGGCTAIIEMRDQELYLVVARTDLENKSMSGTILAVEASKK